MNAERQTEQLGWGKADEYGVTLPEALRAMQATDGLLPETVEELREGLRSNGHEELPWTDEVIQYELDRAHHVGTLQTEDHS